MRWPRDANARSPSPTTRIFRTAGSNFPRRPIRTARIHPRSPAGPNYGTGRSTRKRGIRIPSAFSESPPVGLCRDLSGRIPPAPSRPAEHIVEHRPTAWPTGLRHSLRPGQIHPPPVAPGGGRTPAPRLPPAADLGQLDPIQLALCGLVVTTELQSWATLRRHETDRQPPAAVAAQPVPASPTPPSPHRPSPRRPARRGPARCAHPDAGQPRLDQPGSCHIAATVCRGLGTVFGAKACPNLGTAPCTPGHRRT